MDPISTESSLNEKVSDFSGQRVLVVDDLPDNRLLMEIYLRPFKVTIFTAKSGEEALDMIPIQKPDLILMDIQMTGIDGYEATRQLRKSGLRQPIVALTAYAQKEEIEKCREAGFDMVMTKPVGRQLLAEALHKYLKPVDFTKFP